MNPSMPNITQLISELITLLTTQYPKRDSLLHYNSPFQLLIAVILSAQTTDAQVNAVTPQLFSRYPSPKALAAAKRSEIEHIIYSLGFYKMKAGYIIKTAEEIHKLGAVPRHMDALVRLPGVGRKSASVILAHVYHIPAVIVDTHVMRVCRRIGISSAKQADSMEKELRRLVKEADWIDFSMAVNLHGRYCCHARAPQCSSCVVGKYCTYAMQHEKDASQ